MTNKEKLELLAEALEMDSTDLKPEMKLDEMEEWDSMAKLGMIVLFEDECGKKITRDEIFGFKYVSDILMAMD